MINIALVDDNILLRQNLEEYLKLYPDIQVVLTCDTGLQFLKNVQTLEQSSLPEVLLLAIQGHQTETTEIIYQAKVKFPDMHFILLTATDDDENLMQAIQAGVNSYLLQEEPPAFIVQAIEGTKAGRAYLSPSIAKRILDTLRFHTLQPKSYFLVADSEPVIDTLSKREAEVLELLTAGNSPQIISRKLFISAFTVQTHIKNIYQKLQVHNKWSAVKIAIDRKWFSK